MTPACLRTNLSEILTVKSFFPQKFGDIPEFCAIYVQKSVELNRCFESLVQLAKVLSLFQQFKMDPSGFDPTEHQHRRWNPMTAQWILGNQATMFFRVIISIYVYL